MSVRVILPKRLAVDAKKLETAIRNTITMQAKAAAADFGATTNTWKHRVQFFNKPVREIDQIITTTDPIWLMLEAGTRPHAIMPKPTNKSGLLRFQWGGPGSYKAKTAPGQLTSFKGGARGPIVFRRRVWHPGTAPRLWIPTAAAKWQSLLPETVQRAIDAAVR
jgi:hypothetical protein